MITTRSFLDQTWTDLNSPSKEEADSLILTHNIDPAVAKDMIAPTPAQHVEDHGNTIYTVLYVPTFSRSSQVCEVQEIDCVISAYGLITARYDSIDALHYFAKEIEVNEILNKGEKFHMFFGMMREVYSMMEDELAYMDDRMKEIEKSIFEGREKEMVFSISNAMRNILNFRRVADPHGDILIFLKETGAEKFGKEFGLQIKTLLDEWRHIMRMANDHVDLVMQLRETNNSMLSTKQNEIMKKISILGSILLPLTIIGQIFGLSISYFPLKNHPDAFWIILGFMVATMLLTLTFTKLKKWM